MRIKVLAMVSFLGLNHSLSAAETYSDSSEKRSSSYLNFGVGQEVPIEGYEAPLNLGERNARTQFVIEPGTGFLALPFTYSYGQKINIFGFKPRLQILMPLDSKNFFQFGPGAGGVVNYWYASRSVLGKSIDLNVIELGAQLSAHLKMNLLPNFNIMVTPAAFDFNFYRHTWVETHSAFGNFTDDNDSRGTLYSFSVSAGLSF